jgi:hypothetical protein
MTSRVVRSELTREGCARSSRWERFALTSGLLFAVVQIVTIAFSAVFFATSHPPMDASPAEAARGFAQAETMVATGTYLYVLHLPFWLIFLGGLFGVLSRAEGDTQALAVSVLGAGVAMGVIVSLGALVSSITPTIGALGGDGATVKAIDGMTPLALALSALPRAVLLGVTSAAVLEYRIAPRWIGWTGLVLGLVSLVSTGTLLSPAFFPFLALGTLLFVLWIAALTVALLQNVPAGSRSARTVPDTG